VIIHDVEQGSPEWIKLRLGIPTASEFHRIITPTGQPSGQRERYMARLVAERLLNEPMETLEGLRWIEHGKEQEPIAAKTFEWENGVKTRKVGFVTTDDGKWGASPDRLVDGDNGITVLEIKCPAPQTHAYYWIKGFGGNYKCQVQGQMLVCEAETAIRYSWHPRMPAMQQVCGRDDMFIRTLREALELFSEELEDHVERIRATGYFAASSTLVTPLDREYDGSLHDWTITGSDELDNPLMAG
jgi:hypothetical protein